MLHFSADKLDVVYIGVCNWGEAECLDKVIPSLYGFAKEQDATVSHTNTTMCCSLIF